VRRKFDVGKTFRSPVHDGLVNHRHRSWWGSRVRLSPAERLRYVCLSTSNNFLPLSLLFFDFMFREPDSSLRWWGETS